MTAIWEKAREKDGQFSALDHNTEVDVAVIGGGVTGLTTALRLAEEGRRVAVLEARRIAGGTTGGSTGNLYCTLAKGLGTIREKWGDDITREVVRARARAVDFVEEAVNRLGIDCQFQRCAHYFVATTPEESLGHSLDAEYEAAALASLSASMVDDVPLPFEAYRGLKLDNQAATFNPVSYAQGLAKAVRDAGGMVYERSHVVEADADKGVVRTGTAEVRARHMVHATHTPKGISLLQTEMVPSREYGIAGRMGDKACPEGIFWVLDPFHSVRNCHVGGTDYLIVIGGQHKTGENTVGPGYHRQLQEYATARFGVTAFEASWSAQKYSSGDGLPYIGRNRGADNEYLATGFEADGLTWGTVAGMIISDLVLGRENPFVERFDPRRFTPVKSAREWAKENVSVARHMVKDYLAPERIRELEELDELKPGTGRMVSLSGEKLAVYRREDGRLSVLSAVCPHMRCLVHWNRVEATWDCPCHGSRFDIEGEVIEGPAYHGLARRTPQ